MKSVIFSFFSRVAVTLLNFAIVIITAHQLGAEGRGIISLITLALTYSLLLHQLIGGAPLVYYARKTKLMQLILPSYIWAIIASALVPFVLMILNQLPTELMIHVMLLSVLQAWLATNNTLLLSFEKIKTQNFINFIQVVILVIVLLVSIYVFKITSIQIYIVALYVSFGVAFIISLINVTQLKEEQTESEISFSSLMKGILNYGLIMQATNLAQMFNYRLSYYFVNYFAGTKALGLLSTAMSVVETGWLFSRSLANVQYPKIVNSADEKHQLELTIDYSKMGFYITLVLIIPMILLPDVVYQFLFGKDFSGIKTLILITSPGIIAMGYSTMHAHYFSGISQNKINLYASFIGLAVTLIVGWILINRLQNEGACITYSLSYLANTVYLLILFKQKSNAPFSELLPSVKGIASLLKKATNRI